VLAPHALALEEVDLSANMLRHAARHRQYSTLAQADVVEWMAAHPARYGLIAACDVLIYCGQLASFFTAAHLALQDGGHLVFTVELAGEECDTPTTCIPAGASATSAAMEQACTPPDWKHCWCARKACAWNCNSPCRAWWWWHGVEAVHGHDSPGLAARSFQFCSCGQ
jgi:hypothetical protein